MIVVRIELWPLGDGSRKRVLGTAHIINDGSGDSDTGNYRVELFKSPEYASRPGVWKRGAVSQFPRRSLGPWDLLLRALISTVGYRSRQVVEESIEGRLKGG